MSEHGSSSDPNADDDAVAAGSAAIKAVFDSITPEHFERETSAISEADLTAFEAQLDFDTYGDYCMRHLHVAFVAGNGHVQPFALLQNETMLRVFAADDDETFRHFADRLKREAHQMVASRFFLAGVLDGRRTPDSQTEDVLFYVVSSRESVRTLLHNSGTIFYRGMVLEEAQAGTVDTLAMFDSVLP